MKNPEIEKFLRAMFPERERMDHNKCVFCGDNAVHFRDEISRREFGISGMCQVCQDMVFGVGE